MTIMHFWNNSAVWIKTFEFPMVIFFLKPEMGNNHVITNISKYMVYNIHKHAVKIDPSGCHSLVQELLPKGESN